MNIYLDNSATTKVHPEVVSAMNKIYLEEFGNPSSKHAMGFEAEKIMRAAIASIAKTLHAKESEILITSGGTESDNMAIFGTARAKVRVGKHIITTRIEHPAVSNPIIELEKQGFDVTYLEVDSEGVVTVDAVREALREDTILVSIMMVNNEIGTREPIEEIGAMLKKEAPNAYFHVDAVQGYGKYKIRPADIGIDLMSVSSHKIHGPKGIGFLYIRDGVRVLPLLYGGGQQKDRRPGTENVPGIVGMSKAAELIYEDFDEKISHMKNLRDRLKEGISKIEDVRLNGPADGAPHIVSASFAKISSEVLLHALEDKGIYVSSGSACASNHPGISGTLKAIGVEDEYINGTIRFSMCADNTEEEIDEVIRVLEELVPQLRRFTRK